jgi:hypothetical protein
MSEEPKTDNKPNEVREQQLPPSEITAGRLTVTAAYIGLVAAIILAVGGIAGSLITSGYILPPPTNTPTVSLAPSVDPMFEPVLMGNLVHSNTPNWDMSIEKNPALEGAHQLSDVPFEARDVFGDDASLYYFWLMVENKNRSTAESCGKDIKFRGPELSLHNSVINPSSNDMLDKLQHLFPSANVSVVVSNTDSIIIRVEGQLSTKAPTQGPILLFFYPTLTAGSGTICAGEKLAVPLIAYHYVISGTLLPEDYLRRQIDLEGIKMEWNMLATVGRAMYEEKSYTISTTKDVLPNIE